MSTTDFLLLILCTGLASYLPRALPIMFLAHRKLPDWLVQWLGFIPVAIMASLLAPALLVDESNHFSLMRTEFWVAIPTLLFALKTKSLGGTLFFGMFLFWIAGMFL